jgi:hypothetical protein
MKKTRRKELKYIISYMDYRKIQPLLETFLIHDKHGETASYPVHSIYLDDLEFSGASDKAFGNEFHKKYRIRYYDDLQSMKFEIKEKSGDDSVKTSTMISNQVFDAIVNQDSDVLYQHLDDEVIRRFVLDNNLRHLLPQVVMSYQREAYKDESDNLRITFDHTLCGEIYDPDRHSSDFKLISDHLLILEIKYEHFIPKNIKTIIDGIKLNQVAYSKYFYGYQRAFT